MCTSSRAGVASTISALQDRAMVAAIVAGQLGEQLAHIVAQIEMIDDELAGRTRQRIGSAVEPHAAAGADGSAPPPAGDAVAERREQRRRAALRERRAQLESLRAEAARFADSLRAERARLLRRVSELRRRSALAVVRAADATLPD
jgi:hypothetical protein